MQIKPMHLKKILKKESMPLYLQVETHSLLYPLAVPESLTKVLDALELSLLSVRGKIQLHFLQVKLQVSQCHLLKILSFLQMYGVFFHNSCCLALHLSLLFLSTDI